MPVIIGFICCRTSDVVPENFDSTTKEIRECECRHDMRMLSVCYLAYLCRSFFGLTVALQCELSVSGCVLE